MKKGIVQFYKDGDDSEALRCQCPMFFGCSAGNKDCILRKTYEKQYPIETVIGLTNFSDDDFEKAQSIIDHQKR